MAEINYDDVNVDPVAEKWMLRGVVAFMGGVALGVSTFVADALVELPSIVEVPAYLATGVVLATSAVMAYGGLVMDVFKSERNS